MRKAVVVSAKRTPVGKAPKGVFSKTRPDELAATVIRALISDLTGSVAADLQVADRHAAAPLAQHADLAGVEPAETPDGFNPVLQLCVAYGAPRPRCRRDTVNQIVDSVNYLLREYWYWLRSRAKYSEPRL